MKSLLEEDTDTFYLYHPELTDLMNRHGDRTCAIDNYETDGWKIDLVLALKQTLFALSPDQFVDNKTLILITDRLQDDKALRKVSLLNEQYDFVRGILVVGIGEFYNQTACECPGVGYRHLEDASELGDYLIKELNGCKECECPTDQQ
jgi:hypothetical protein